MRKLLLRCLLVVATVLVGTLIALLVRVHRLGDALVDDVRRYSAPRTRQVHRGPAVGTTYGACLGPLLDANTDAGVFAAGRPELKDAIADVVDGGAPFGGLPEAVRSDLAALTPWLDQALACTRAPATSGDVLDLGPFASWESPRWRTPFYAAAQAKMGALVVRAELERGDVSGALARCADILAVLRDAVPERGLMGAMFAASGVRDVSQPCGAAIDAAGPAALRQFLAELTMIRRTFLSFSEVLELERLQIELMLYGRELTAAQRARLSPTAQRAATGDSMQLTTDWDFRRLVTWLSWMSVDARARRRAEAAAATDRARAFDAVDEGETLASLFFPEWSSPPGSWERYAERDDARARGLDLLESAARVSLGEAPLAGVDVTRDAHAVELSVPWADEQAKLTLRIRTRALK